MRKYDKINKDQKTVDSWTTTVVVVVLFEQQ
jgi:hypothetical protein